MSKGLDHARILIVDDEPANIQILHQILKGDYQSCFALSGEEAIEACLKCPPDLILLDVVMPNMDGYEVCRRLKANPETCDIPVIFATAQSSEEDEMRALEVGAIDFFTKPVSPPIVKARVRTHLELKRQRDLLRSISYIDGLTGVANRRRFDESLETEWRRCRRSGLYLGLIIIDVDYFKLYNDHYGHLAGDECLRRLAAAIADQVKRPGDLAARYGGEEFALLLPETKPIGLQIMAERLVRGINTLAIPHAGSMTTRIVTISCGGTVSRASSKCSAEDLLGYADALLYQAKQRGRNQAVVKAFSESVATLAS